jgi:hypothetical protein
MTLDEFLTKRPDIVTSPLQEQFLAVAWFLRKHGGMQRFTLREIMARFKEAGMVGGELPILTLNMVNKTLSYEVEGDNHYYGLLRQAVIELDVKYNDCIQPKTSIAVINAIAELPNKHPSLANCPYWEEAMVCYRHQALRAAFIMVWNLIYDRLCEFVLADPNGRLANFNTASKKIVTSRDDFTEYREAEVILWCKTAKIIPGNVHTILAEKLKRRNMFAHASRIIPIEHEVDANILDLVTNVLPRLV